MFHHHLVNCAKKQNLHVTLLKQLVAQMECQNNVHQSGMTKPDADSTSSLPAFDLEGTAAWVPQSYLCLAKSGCPCKGQ